MSNKNLFTVLKILNTKNLILTLLVFCFGAISVIAARFILVEKQTTHYHANFALYLNGKKEEFNSFVYYEEVSACTDEYSNNPKSRVHMHNNINNIVHVHDTASTWSHFFSNIGITFADGVLVKSGSLYRESSEQDFTYVLNGKKIESISDKVIGSGDTLLINVGNESDKIINERYEQIIKNANQYNEKPDPSSCSGSNSESLLDRLMRTLTK